MTCQNPMAALDFLFSFSLFSQQRTLPFHFALFAAAVLFYLSSAAFSGVWQESGGGSARARESGSSSSSSNVDGASFMASFSSSSSSKSSGGSGEGISASEIRAGREREKHRSLSRSLPLSFFRQLFLLFSFLQPATLYIGARTVAGSLLRARVSHVVGPARSLACSKVVFFCSWKKSFWRRSGGKLQS